MKTKREYQILCIPRIFHIFSGADRAERSNTTRYEARSGGYGDSFAIAGYALTAAPGTLFRRYRARPRKRETNTFSVRAVGVRSPLARLEQKTEPPSHYTWDRNPAYSYVPTGERAAHTHTHTHIHTHTHRPHRPHTHILFLIFCFARPSTALDPSDVAVGEQ